ncbi:MAG: hypothetical protein CMI01_11830 [Oceanospirillaceae bacterium]|jgi:hypothetical protein|uniref:CCE_0567 family metalloprotein n=1 Tax=Marinobacterium litorale TaxID=404770 RepID=UPI00041875F5|nr:CCE_0567 family metalloprotein [Marinobacterium litorale]MBS99351.1 hypothetical protein [Oceanospirillaceae bacterium]
MSDEELKKLQKEARKAKRIATECASQVHDVVEDSLWTEYESLPALAQKTVDACLAWKEAQAKLEAAEG